MSTATLDMPAKSTTRPNQATAPAGIDRIVLTGFMGSGKSTVGALLAGRLGWRFLDLDREIERRDGRPVPEIFRESTEAHFRHLETAALAALLGQRRVVVALGGGAPEELGNRLLLEQTPRTAVVYLSAPYATLVDRCVVQAAEPGSTARPVLADLAAAEERFHQRRPHYERIASHCVDTSELQLEATVSAVLRTLQVKA
jgi:shikimate kinase